MKGTQEPSKFVCFGKAIIKASVSASVTALLKHTVDHSNSNQDRIQGEMKRRKQISYRLYWFGKDLPSLVQVFS